MMSDLSKRKRHWEKQYTEKDPLEVSWYQSEPVLSLHLIAECGLDPADPIIDVGGGASMLVDRLCDLGFRHLAVLDLSARALELAKQRLEARAREIDWIEQDITVFDAPQKYALWHDRAVFHFLTDKEDLQNYRRALDRALLPGGYVILAAFAPGGPEKCSGLEIVQYDGDRLKEEFGPHYTLLEERVERHVTPAGREQKFCWFRLKRN